MDLKTLLSDPECCPSVAYAAFKKLVGEEIEDWEPDTIRIELDRYGIEVTDSLMTKVLGAQTILKTWYWISDHDVLFAFALACDGIPAAAEKIHHPTVEQLAWAMLEVTSLRGKLPTDDEGFDPDTVDPAMAVVLFDEGWVLAPKELSFCQEVLDHCSKSEPEFTREVRTAWAEFQDLTSEELQQKVEGLKDSALHVQLRHLADCRLQLGERERQRAQQHVWLSGDRP